MADKVIGKLMSENTNRKNSFILQAGILAAAGIVTRIIGLLYRSPLHHVIGSLGFGYYSVAYNYYTIVLLIASYSIPTAISKLIAQKLALREYKNAHKVFRCALIYVLAVGGAASLFLFFGAGLLVVEEVIPVLRVFAPTIFIYGILGVFRGYFQAHNSMVQTSLSQILEQIANAAVSIGAAYLLIRVNMGSMEIPADEAAQSERAIYGAVGSALGTGAGVLAALLLIVWLYSLNRESINKKIQRDRHVGEDSYKMILKSIVLVVTPFILSTAINNLNSAVNTSIYTKLFPAARETDSMVIHSNAGIFSEELSISNIPIAFASAMAAAIIPLVAQCVSAGDIHTAKEKIAMAMKTTMIISIPSAVGLFVLARPVTGLLFPNTEENEILATKILMALALSVIFFALATLNSNILQGLGKVNTPIINAGIALAVQTVAAIALLFLTKMDIYSIAIANTLYSGVTCVLNQQAVGRAIGYRQEVVKTFVIPAMASVSMGAGAWATYEGLMLLTASPKISVVVAILVAAGIYFAMLLLLRGITEEELRGFPKGYLLVRLAKRCRLMR